MSPDMSFLEVLDVLNERLILEGDEPVAFDHDCPKGIPLDTIAQMNRDYLRASK